MSVRYAAHYSRGSDRERFWILAAMHQGALRVLQKHGGWNLDEYASIRNPKSIMPRVILEKFLP